MSRRMSMMPAISENSPLSEEIRDITMQDSPTELVSFVRETSPPLFGIGTSQTSLHLSERKNDSSPIV